MSEIEKESEDTYKIKGVRIFSEGKWNGTKITPKDLEEMVESFGKLKTGFKPFLKFGHENEQRIRKSSGLPSIGWVEDLYVKGKHLFADISYIPKKVYEVIKNKAYRYVSCEVYSDLEVEGTTYPKVLGALSLLGAENPGVMNLDEILAQYSLINTEGGVFEAITKSDSFKEYSTNLETYAGDEMSEELQKVTEELEAKKTSFALLETEKTDLQKKLETEQAEKTKLEGQLQEFKLKEEASRLEAEKTKVALFVTELEGKKLVSPAMKDLVQELMSDKKEFSVKEKTLSKGELIEQILTLSHEAAKVNFDESSKATFGKKESEVEIQDQEIQKYATENKCSYGVAYREIKKQKSQKASEE
jgi:hypothetical protein